MADPAALPFRLSPDIQKAPVPHNINDCRDKSCYSDSCGATRLDVKSHPLIAYRHMLLLLTEFTLRLAYSSVQLALRSPFTLCPACCDPTARSSL